MRETGEMTAKSGSRFLVFYNVSLKNIKIIKIIKQFYNVFVCFIV